MVEIVGDFWQVAHKYDALVCTTNKQLNKNGELIMGAGIAKDFKEYYPDLPKIWGNRITNGDHINGMMATYYNYDGDTKSGQYLIAFPTKNNWSQNSSFELIKASASTLIYLADLLGLQRILMTRPGCGNGGLCWVNVQYVLLPLLDNRFEVINNV